MEALNYRSPCHRRAWNRRAEAEASGRAVLGLETSSGLGEGSRPGLRILPTPTPKTPLARVSQIPRQGFQGAGLARLYFNLRLVSTPIPTISREFHFIYFEVWEEAWDGKSVSSSPNPSAYARNRFFMPFFKGKIIPRKVLPFCSHATDSKVKMSGGFTP